MGKNLPLILVGAGALTNIVDAYTAKGAPEGGFFYGPGGLLKPINDALPVNLGLLLMLIGAALWIWAQFS